VDLLAYVKGQGAQENSGEERGLLENLRKRRSKSKSERVVLQISWQNRNDNVDYLSMLA
jgi:hypothetical protein